MSSFIFSLALTGDLVSAEFPEVCGFSRSLSAFLCLVEIHSIGDQVATFQSIYAPVTLSFSPFLVTISHANQSCNFC